MQPPAKGAVPKYDPEKGRASRSRGRLFGSGWFFHGSTGIRTKLALHFEPTQQEDLLLLQDGRGPRQPHKPWPLRVPPLHSQGWSPWL